MGIESKVFLKIFIHTYFQKQLPSIKKIELKVLQNISDHKVIKKTFRKHISFLGIELLQIGKIRAENSTICLKINSEIELPCLDKNKTK